MVLNIHQLPFPALLQSSSSLLLLLVFNVLEPLLELPLLSLLLLELLFVLEQQLRLVASFGFLPLREHFELLLDFLILQLRLDLPPF